MPSCQGISFLIVKGMPFSMSAMRFMRAKGEGVALMSVIDIADVQSI